MASAAFVVDLVLIGVAVATMNTEQWQTVLNHLSLQKEVSSYELLVGFSAVWRAFSGLESISQLSPAMRYPLRHTTRLAMTAVMITMIITSPVLTALSVGLLADPLKATQSERFIWSNGATQLSGF
jgi:amino acid transporter